MQGKKEGSRRFARAGAAGKGLRPLAWALLAASGATAQAQQAAGQADAAATLAPVTVSANPLGLDLNSTTQPASVLEGDALVEKRGGTLGDTLDGLPGVHSDTFGGGASRPVIRGRPRRA